MEGIFIQAMAASGVKDLLRGDDGIECMQQLVNEFHLQKEENQSLQELLAESRSQILGSQAQCVKLQDMLVSALITIGSLDTANSCLPDTLCPRF